MSSCEARLRITAAWESSARRQIRIPTTFAAIYYMIDTLEQDPQPSAPGATVKSASDDGSWALRNRAGVRLQSHEADKSRELDDRLKQNEALPIHSLPTEIFLHVIHHHMRPYLKHYHGLNYYHRLISLTGVCSRWCNVIRGSPSLWNRIHWSDSSEVVEIALRRSSNHPLDVVLDTEHVPRDQAFMSSLITALNPHRDRWRSMDFAFLASRRGDVISALREPALSLEKLSLHDEETRFSTEEFDFFRGSAPRLTELTLNGISLCWDSEVIHDLTVLDLSYISFPSPTTILNVLSHSPRLRTVAFSRCTIESMANPSSPRIQLPHLTSLEIDLGGLGAIEGLLDHIETPGPCSLATSLLHEEKIEEFLERRVLKWMSKWEHPALVPLEGLLLEIDFSDLRVELSTVDRLEPLALAIECSWFSPQAVDQLRMALPRFIDALVPWTKDVTTLRLRLGHSPSGPHDLSFKQFIIEQVSRLPPVTSLEVWGIEIDSFLHGIRLGEVSSLLRNVHTLSFSRINAGGIRDCLDWMCETAQIVKDAAEDSSDEPNHRGRVLKLELRVLHSVTSDYPELVETAVKRLEEHMGTGNVLVI